MDVFELRERVIGDYADYVRSFLRIGDQGIKAYVERELASGRLWPDPLVQLNPSFEPGGAIDDLVAAGLLHAECRRIFRRGKDDGSTGLPMRLHRHQQDALEVARTGRSYVLTTGTGSGKSLAYFVPIIDHVLRQGSRRGIKAIVVYPMNALCNSQLEELRKFLKDGYGKGREPVTFERYTGQEKEEDRARIAANPPDILLTNYVMLELLMTRVDANDRQVIRAAEGLEFLVLDELHTYRGRQGADVAMLVRRVRERLGAPTMRCIGTSATMAGAGTREERAADVAEIASRLFGTEVAPEHVIGETLRSAVRRGDPSAAELRSVLADEPYYPAEYTALAEHPLAAWAETAFGIRRDERGRLERRPPATMMEAAHRLSAETGIADEHCRAHLQAILLAGYRTAQPDTGLPLFAFRLHQFVSRGDTVYSSIEMPERRHLALEGQVFVPGSRDRRLYPLAFCRECGQPYYVVDRLPRHETLEPRDLSDIAPDGSDERHSGYLYLDLNESWLPDENSLPEDWLEPRADGTWRVKSANRKWVPTRHFAHADGRLSSFGGDGAVPAWFAPAPFRFCLNCGVSYSGRAAEFAKLAEMATEGRSTATTILSLAIVRALKQMPPPPEGISDKARKLLSFTDNRQDASLQAGHLNDFVQVGLLRGALFAAVAAAGDEGITHDTIAERVTAALGLTFEDYAANPEAGFLIRRRIEQALRDVVGYRIYHDLRRGWRVNAPNLEQTGLLRVRYDALDELCAAEEVWRDRHPILAGATPEQRERACHVVLDAFRRELAIKVPYLDRDRQEGIKSSSYQFLRPPWAIEEDEELADAPVFRVGTASGKPLRFEKTISATSGLGRFLRRRTTWPDALEKALSASELPELATDLLGALTIGGHVEDVSGKGGRNALYQLQAGAIRWLAGDGTPPEADPLRIARATSADGQTNAFFCEFYAQVARNLREIEAREHTAQVPTAKRQEREEEFREGTLAVLYCSPTMELGVDIADLNAVNLRNVPPTPANYAQRSGRAGRSGQPALVLTYCSSLSPHDQYFFRRQGQMVAGAVLPPRLDLANEDLIRSHFHAVWLAETGQSLGHSLGDVLDLARPKEGLPLREDVAHGVQSPQARREAAWRCRNLADALAGDLAGAVWFGDEWLDRTIASAAGAFDRACDRWRQLYLAARTQREAQHAIAGDHSTSPEARRTAERLRGEAETQLRLLVDGDSDLNSDFYSYRYFASEGFLPGYNFPRLPLSAYLPGRLRKSGRDEFVSRARFLAISEFGPRSIIYYEGSRFRVDKVILPLYGSEGAGSEGSRTITAKFCAACGYGHLGADSGLELCEGCGARLDGTARYFPNLFRLQNVATRRIDRITSDEEERMRLGYELMTAYRFAETKDGPAVTRADYLFDGEPLATAAYAPTATLWRINLGWNRRKDKGTFGFLLDMEKGHWAKQDVEPQGKDSDGGSVEPLPTQERVVPIVEDRRNTLLIEPGLGLNDQQYASLLYALKRGVEARFQLEDSELGGGLLPSGAAPSQILLYEAAEGGAGVLSRLVQQPNAIAEVARAALEICHFDPATGEDKRKANGAAEDCEAACYNCLLGYTNQREHDMLDRQAIKEVLLQLARATARTGAGREPREAARDTLLARCESELERRFVRFLDEGGYRLPDRAQPLLADFGTRPDFFYDETQTCVYVDGPYHEFPERQERDRDIAARLLDGGYDVVRVGGEESWGEAMANYSWVFGSGERRVGEG